jgi:hypothetical protein
MVSMSELAAAFVGLPFAPPLLLVILLGEVTAFYASYLRYRRRYC